MEGRVGVAKSIGRAVILKQVCTFLDLRRDGYSVSGDDITQVLWESEIPPITLLKRTTLQSALT